MNLAARNRHSVSLMMCDVDYYKKYNDSLGHYAGDECLKSIAEALRKICARSVDLLFRYGGEEFAVLIMENEESVAKIAEKMRKEIHELTLHHPTSPLGSVTLSICDATIWPTADTVPRDLIEKADKALYQSKKFGRNTVSEYHSKS